MDTMAVYLRDIAKANLLKPAEKNALIRKAQRGDKQALNAVVSAHLKMVVAIACKYISSCALPLEDLIQEGNLGLFRAVRLYNPKKSSFTTYSYWWVRHCIQRAIHNFEHRGCLRTPKMRSLDSLLKNSAGSVAEIFAGSEKTPIEIAEETEDMNQRRNAVRETLKTLPRMHRNILVFRISGAYTLQELGDRYNLSRERIRQIEFQALNQIRRRLGTDKKLD